MEETNEITMAGMINGIEGVGDAALRVFEAAGMRVVGDLKALDVHESTALADAVRKLKLTSEFGDVYWKRMLTRCLNIVHRVQSAKASSFVPAQLMCPISLDWFNDPVITPYGHSYSRAAIMEHLAGSQTDPMTRKPLRADQLIKNLDLREATDFCRRHHQVFAFI